MRPLRYSPKSPALQSETAYVSDRRFTGCDRQAVLGHSYHPEGSPAPTRISPPAPHGPLFISGREGERRPLQEPRQPRGLLHSVSISVRARKGGADIPGGPELHAEHNVPFYTVSCREEPASAPAWPRRLDTPADGTRSLNFDLDRGVFPVVIQAMVDEGDGLHVRRVLHTHRVLVLTTVAGLTGALVGSFSRAVDRVSYLLQEIYGIENKNNQETKPSDEENSDNSSECVVCLSDLRDTLILPCRHLCLCNSCADTLRYQASNCPICRLPFRALLQIRAVRKKPGALSPISFSPVLAQSMDHDEHSCPFKKSKSHPASLASKKPKRETSADSIPPGYEPISLLEALNGLRAVPLAGPPAVPTAPLYEEITYSGVSDGLSQASCPLAGIDRMVESSLQKGKPRSKSPDSTLRSPSSPIHEEDDSEALPPPSGAGPALSSSPESFMTETVDETSSVKQGSRLPSIENVLQDGSPEPCGRSQPGAPADVYLPGWSTSMETPRSLHATGHPRPPLGGPSPDPRAAELTPL
ncbi:hypothetical protein FD754_013908 [Muntiacus muntjak]|uniref:E3 ubiquitin-protein ligase n=1 Tax=Muntiacus muntjak TaxID=9888 RepID=A0A5N3VIG3_MUNMU|nr:hypothetical protein FD754_013908 [Muntiacus muntjak]